MLEVIPLHFNATTVLPHFVYLFEGLGWSLISDGFSFLSDYYSNQAPVLKALVAANCNHLLFILCSIFLNKQNKIYLDLQHESLYGLLFSMTVHDTKTLRPTLSPLLSVSLYSLIVYLK